MASWKSSSIILALANLDIASFWRINEVDTATVASKQMASAVQMRSWKWLAAKAMKLETVQLLSYYNSNIQQHYWFIGREKEKFCDKQAVILNLRLLQFYSNGESWRSKLWALGCSGLKLVGRNILTVFENYSKILILASEANGVNFFLKNLGKFFFAPWKFFSILRLYSIKRIGKNL